MHPEMRAAREARAALAGDPQRPQYHFLAPANWMNDPNGPICWRGRYHLFYQHNPHRPDWGVMHWGHAASEDLVHWEDLPIALAPTPGGPDEAGCWSGCAVDDGGTPTLVYTGVSGRSWGEVQETCVATSDGDLLTWRKHSANPVLAAPPGLELAGFRDPCVWREGDSWLMAIGSGMRGRGGAVLLFRSADLVRWEYLHPLYTQPTAEADPTIRSHMWECPQFFALGDRHVLVVSVMAEGRPGHVAFLAGRYAGHRFEPQAVHRLDYGADYYAPSTLLDAEGRRIMWGWSWEARAKEAQWSAGWAGVMSLPRVLTLRPDGRVGAEPAPELQALRKGGPIVVGAPADAARRLAIGGDSLEILAEWEPDASAERFGLRLRCSPDGEEETLVLYDRAARRISVDRNRASLDPAAHGGVHGGPLELGPGQPLRLHVFLDRSIVEVYAHGVCLTERIYPSRTDSLGVGLFAQGGGAPLRSLRAWELAPIW